MITTYAELNAAVMEWANHSLVTTGKAAEFISAAERRAYKVLRIREMEYTTGDYNGSALIKDALIDGETQYLTLPSDFLELKDLWLYLRITEDAPPPEFSYGTRYPNASRTSLDTVQRMLYERTGGNYPCYFARDNTQLWFAPVPSSYFVRMTYWAKPDALSTALNSVFTASPEMYLYGALAEAALFIRKPEDAASFDGRFTAEINLLKAQTQGAEWSGGGLVQRAGAYG